MKWRRCAEAHPTQTQPCLIIDVMGEGPDVL